MKVLLVDENNKVIGKQDKLKVHKLGLLHRAFSIFIFNSKNELLIQKRALDKYHTSGLWSNTCCSHPYTENIKQEAKKRLQEEMGFSCNIKKVFSFIYKVDVGNNLIEHEYDHVFLGRFDGQPVLNPQEAEDWQWIGLEELERDIKENPEKYTYWFKIALPKLVSYLKTAGEL